MHRPFNAYRICYWQCFISVRQLRIYRNSTFLTCCACPSVKLKVEHVILCRLTVVCSDSNTPLVAFAVCVMIIFTFSHICYLCEQRWDQRDSNSKQSRAGEFKKADLTQYAIDLLIWAHSDSLTLELNSWRLPLEYQMNKIRPNHFIFLL